MLAWALRLPWAICCALAVLLVPSAAWSADTEQPRSSPSFSRSAGSSSGSLGLTLPVSPPAISSVSLTRTVGLTSTPSRTLSSVSRSDSLPSSAWSRSSVSSVSSLTHCGGFAEPACDETALVCGTETAPCYVMLPADHAPIPMPCGTEDSPCQAQLPVEDRALLMLGFGLLVMLGAARLVSGWGAD